jgi:ferric-dicitrate binding protein FerR (iron transport regulator)
MNKEFPNKDQHSRFFEKAQIPYSRSKEDVWNEMMDKMQERKEPAGKTRRLVFYWAAAALVALLIGISSFMRFYSKTLSVPPGQHLSHTLPGGSKVHLNAGTKLNYHPYWWRFARLTKLEGEAYFEIKKGKSFAVKSSQGETRVLGTRFNIYARNKDYRVHCISGKVQVESSTGRSKILETNQAVKVSDRGEMEYQTNVKAKQAIAWTKNQFVYTAAPLREVLKEMERQFDISIELEPGIEGEYTGNFQRGGSPEAILKMITRPFGLEVQQIHQTRYRITKNRD